MKVYRIVYWFNSITTEKYIKADSKEEAIEKFNKITSGKTIISIEEVEKM